MPLSTKQCEYLALAWQCMESEPKIDYEKFRQIAGLASAHSARELLRVTKKKLREEYGATTSTPTSTPQKGGPSGAVDGGAPGTPSRAKTTTPGKAKIKEMSLDDRASAKRGRPNLQQFDATPKKVKVEPSDSPATHDDTDNEMPME